MFRRAGFAALPTALAALAVLAAPAAAAGGDPLQAPGTGLSAHRPAAEEARIAAYWTPERMREAPPLEGSASDDPLATASFEPVAEATVAPYAANGRIFIRQGRSEGYCSGTAINTPSRRLVLTAGHCVNTGPRGPRGSSAWSRYMEFVPAYTDGTAPFGVFVARRPQIHAPKAWVLTGNPNYDVGAFQVGLNELGQNVADAVGGGVTIALDRSRKERFQSFGYPGRVRRMQLCESPATGEDRFTNTIPGPSTMGIRCRWQPGASGGGWLINGGAEINGLTSYSRNGDQIHTFGPYFSRRNVGALVAGL